MFTLPDPPGFKGLDPESEVRLHRRHLPHWHQDGATYFLTFRTADSIPASKTHELQLLKGEIEAAPEKDRARIETAWRDFVRLMERFLDEGHGACVLRDPEFSEIVAAAMRHFDGDRYALFAYTVMPNHVHVVVRPHGDHGLGAILKSWKSFSARLINGRLKQGGNFWQAESYDRIVRDGEELYRFLQYIGRNGAKAGLPQKSFRRWLCPAWERAGWGFVG